MKIRKCILFAVIACAILLAGCGHRVPTWQEQYDLGIRYLSEGSYEEAVIAFTAAIEINPKQAPAYVRRGDAYVGLGETEENLASAQADYEQAIELDETLAEAYLGLADVYVRRGEYEKAYEILKTGKEGSGGDERIAEKIAEIESGIYTDSSNQIRRKDGYDVNGILESYTLYQYDFLGRRHYWENYRIASGETTDEPGKFSLIDYCEVDFDEENRPIQYKFYGPDGATSSYDTFVYGENGLKTEQHRFEAGGTERVYFLYYYNEQGQEVKYEGYHADGKMYNYWVSEYDENGDLVKKTRYLPDGTEDGYQIYK